MPTCHDTMQMIRHSGKSTSSLSLSSALSNSGARSDATSGAVSDCTFISFPDLIFQ